MTDVSRWRRMLRLPGGDPASAVHEEIAFHLEERARELVARGLAPDEARRQALRDFGALPDVEAACVAIERRRQRRLTLTEVAMSVLHDLRFAARTLRTSPGFTTAAVACVALGIAVATTIFSAVEGVLLRPLPFQRPDELVAVYGHWVTRGERGSNISYPDYLSWRDENRTFAQLGMWTWSSLTLSGGGDEAERVEGASVTPNLFPLLGVQPLLGRGFQAGEDQAGAERVILLGYGLWQRRHAGDRTIVGKRITVNGEPHTVVGVMPRGFAFPQEGQAWRPLVVDLARETHGNRWFAGALGRLVPGATLEQARRDLGGIMARLARELPDQNAGWDADVVSLREDLAGDLRRPLQVFAGAVLLVLLVACANVANLLLARGATRGRELAVRTALGAGRGRIVRQLLVESLLLAAMGGAAGATLAVYGVQLLRLSFPDGVPYYFTLDVDAAALAFAAVATIVAAVAFGIVPALRASATSLDAALREGARGATAGGGRGRLRDTLVVAEMALSLVLMIGAGLLIKSYRALSGTDVGFVAENALTFRVALPASRYQGPARRLAYMSALHERLRALPGVAAVAFAQGTPFSGWNVQAGLTVEGRATRPGEELDAHYQVVSHNYLATLGVPLTRGRALAASDRDSLAPVVVVNEEFARRIFSGEDPIGRRVHLGGPDDRDPWATIVGVARTFRHYRLPEPMGPAMYYPYAAAPTSQQTFLVRARDGRPEHLVPAIRAAMRELDPDVPMFQVQTMTDVVGSMLWQSRLQGQVLGLFAALALLLAVVGIYGVVSYAVVQRRREFGVRIALGARPADVVWLVVRHGARLALLGAAIGVAGALALTRVLTSLLYDVRPADPVVFVGVPVVLGAVAVLASYLPARRAARVDPLLTMRMD
jgi:putative ABC transport system permease protein